MPTRSSGRQFQWARTQGVLGSAVGFAQRADLLEAVRGRHGEAFARGATVMGIRGYVVMYAGGGTGFAHGRVGIRVANLGDLAAGTPVTAGSPFTNPEARWMWMLQCTINSSVTPIPGATSNVGANDWAVDIQSHRKMDEAGTTLLLHGDYLPTSGDPEWAVDYDLSIGMKLA